MSPDYFEHFEYAEQAKAPAAYGAMSGGTAEGAEAAYLAERADERAPASLSREHVELPPAEAEWVRTHTRAEVFERYPCSRYENGKAVKP